VKRELLWYRYGEEDVLGKCSKIKELKLLSNGLHLYYNSEPKTLISLPSIDNKNNENRYTLTIKKNVRNFDFKLITMDMKNHEIVWGYSPVKFLNSLENREHIYKDGSIDVANNFTVYDKLMARDTTNNKFAYLSNNFGLQLEGKDEFV